MGLLWAKGLFVSAFEWFLPTRNQKLSALLLAGFPKFGNMAFRN
jgi:hypothetical protein